MYNCDRFRKRSLEIEQGRARIYPEAYSPKIYGPPLLWAKLPEYLRADSEVA